MFKAPVPLAKNDLIAIVAPAKAIENELVLAAKTFFEKNGFQVVLGENVCGQENYFSGSEADRLRDMQWALDHPEVKAIVCARGGYGCVQLVDRVNWAGQIRDPKWILGFSDVTVFHQRMQRHGIQSIHCTMPLNFGSNSEASLETMLQAIRGENYSIEWETNSHNRQGETTGIITGGNLSILYSLLGTDDQLDFENKILFIEDLSEQIYHIDRMFYAFSKSGVLDQISGLVVGGMTDLKDTANPFGKTYQEVILSHFNYRQIPIAFDCPAGHINDNRALVFGKTVRLSVGPEGSGIFFS